MIPGRKYTLASVARMLWAGKLLLIVLPVVGLAIATWRVAQIPSAYRSGSTVLVLPQVVPENMVRSTVTLDLEERLRTLSDQVFAPDRLATMASELKVYPELAHDPMAAGQRLRSRTSVDIVRADAFRITFMHRDAATTARVTARLAKTFVDENLRERTRLAEGTARFFDDQLQRTRERLTEHEDRLEQYRRAYAGQLPSQLSSNLQVIQNGQVQLRALADSIHAEREQRLRIEQTLASIGPDEDAPASTGEPAAAPEAFDPLVDEATQLRGREAVQALPRVRAQLRSMELQLKPDHPDMVRVRRILGELERRAAADPDPQGPVDETAGGRTGRARQLRADLAALDRRLAARETEEAQLRDQISRYQQRVELMPNRETELTTLMRDYDSLRESYGALLLKKEEAQMSAELERRQVGESMRIIAAAQVPGAPFYPNRPAAMLTGVLTGAALALLVIGWREFQDRSLRTEGEVTAVLDVPVVALIPVIPLTTDERRTRVRRAAVVGSAACLVVAVVLLFYFRSGLGL